MNEPGETMDEPGEKTGELGETMDEPGEKTGELGEKTGELKGVHMKDCGYFMFKNYLTFERPCLWRI